MAARLILALLAAGQHDHLDEMVEDGSRNMLRGCNADTAPRRAPCDSEPLRHDTSHKLVVDLERLDCSCRGS
jgi:hypothetical protein